MLDGGARFLDAGERELGRVGRLRRTETALERTRGLLGSRLGDDEGLWITPCNSVHTFGMTYPIDVVYLDRRQVVRKITPRLSPRRLSFCLFARSTLELPAGRAAQISLQPGVKMEWLPDA
jgi:uncharacterized membrane protein (UPF0127 family)